ncbi:hypothetical protein [Pedobacter faecalis]|uniref:hypothetical protein n=1 Tax=Pedobacter faecalis TaxID=3041495 RepID=UPI00254B8FE8|nr:hypothetical protein [Pedobacter sp. ELA7]
MNKLRQYTLAAMVTLVAISFQACKKDPKPEIPEEEIGKAELVFVEVEREAHDDHFHYNPIPGAEAETITFDANGLPPVGTHLHLHEGATYKVTLKAYDFAGREMQQEFLDKPDIHQAFILGAPEGVFTYVYGDQKDHEPNLNVGVTGYLTVNSHTDKSFVFRYVLRHLNPGVKANITAANWNDPNFATKYAGANDLDLKFECHPVEEDGHDHD